jgi:hypothetical protein
VRACLRVWAHVSVLGYVRVRVSVGVLVNMVCGKRVCEYVCVCESVRVCLCNVCV